MEPYQVYVRAKAFDFLGQVGRPERAILWNYFDALGRDPFQPFDFTEIIADREMSVKILNRHAITYWVDHAVKEVKIVALRDADRH